MSLRDYLEQDIEIVEGEKDEYLSNLLELVFEFIDNSIDMDSLDENSFELLEEILDFTNTDEEDHIEEARTGKRKKVVRQGKKQRKVSCPDNYKAVDKGGAGKKCVKMSQSEKRTRSKASKRAAKKKTNKTSSERKRKRSMKRRTWG